MSVPRQSFSSTAADAEITAELPVLDVAAHEAAHGHDPLASTDSWDSHTLNTAILPQLSTVAPDPAPEPPSSAAAAKLEAELRSLASNLSELETRLAAKGERLMMIEAELAEAIATGRAAAERAAALTEELAASKSVVAATSIQIEELQGTLREREESLRLAAERESELRQSLQRRDAEVVGAAASDAARVAALTASHQFALNAAHQQVAQLQAQSAAQLEALHCLEGRRGIFDSILRALDIQIAGRDAEQARLMEDLARKATHGQDLSHELDSRRQRVAQLESDIAELNARLGARDNEALAITRSNDELKQSLQSLGQQSAAQAARIADLETQNVAAAQQVAALAAQVAAHTHTIEAEAEARHGAEERLASVEEELRISAAAVVSLELELGSRSMRVEELLHTNARMHADIEEAKRWLGERDALMRRLETEAAHSAAVVDNIQRSIRTPATGSDDAQAVNPQNGMRLLVRSKGGHEEIVHLLGRKTSIGRTPDNDLQIDASYISRHHAVILTNGEHTVIEDLNSTNGVQINGQRITRENLKDGDMVMVGKAAFRFVIRPSTSA